MTMVENVGSNVPEEPGGGAGRTQENDGPVPEEPGGDSLLGEEAALKPDDEGDEDAALVEIPFEKSKKFWKEDDQAANVAEENHRLNIAELLDELSDDLELEEGDSVRDNLGSGELCDDVSSDVASTEESSHSADGFDNSDDSKEQEEVSFAAVGLAEAETWLVLLLWELCGVEINNENDFPENEVSTDKTVFDAEFYVSSVLEQPLIVNENLEVVAEKCDDRLAEKEAETDCDSIIDRHEALDEVEVKSDSNEKSLTLLEDNLPDSYLSDIDEIRSVFNSGIAAAA